MSPRIDPAFIRILVPLDGSALAEQALPYAGAIGGEAAELLLLTILLPAVTQWDLLGRKVGTVRDGQSNTETEALHGLLRAERTWLGEESRCQHQVTTGDPAAVILRVAEERNVDLIAMASHGRGALGRFAFGSVAD